MDFRNLLGTLNQLNEDVEVVSEKAESKNQATAARIALKHKKEGTKPKAGTASAEMMKMSKSDLEDFTKAKKGAPKKKTNESFEEAELRRLAGLPEASIQEADMDLSDKTEELTQWVLKYDDYRGDNGDALPMGWIKSMTATGVSPDGWEENEWEAYQEKLGKDITDMDNAEIDAFLDDPDNSPITSAMIDDLLKITGASEADEDLARSVSSAIGIGESIQEGAGSLDSETVEAILKLKEVMMDKGMEPEEAQDEAAEAFGIDPEELADYLDSQYDESLEEEADIDLSKYSKEMLDKIKNASDAELNKMAVDYGGSSMEIGREEELFRKIRAQLNKQDESVVGGNAKPADPNSMYARLMGDINEIQKGAMEGNDMADDIADELGDYLRNGDAPEGSVYEKAIGIVMDALHDGPDAQAEAAEQAGDFLHSELNKEDFDRNSFRESFMRMVEAKSKPDFLDLDKDGDKKEPMKKAAKDAKEKGGKEESGKKGMTDKQKKYFGKKDESVEEGKSKHPKGSAKYKKQMAAKHASMNEELAEDDLEFDMDMPVDPDQEMTASPEQAIDQADEIDMAMGQLEFIKYAAEEIKGHFKMGFEMEEWFQNKLARMHGTMMTLHAYIEGEEGKAGMNESINENDMFNQMPQGMKDKILQMYTKKLGGDKNKAMELLQMVLSPEGQKKIKSPQGQRIIGATPQQMKDPKNQALMQKAKKMDQFQTSMGESINESFEKFMNNDKLSFEEAMKIVRESGGQQKIDPVDTKLWTWAKRVASNKFTESSKAELYAGVIYERNGGVFELTDVLNESK